MKKFHHITKSKGFVKKFWLSLSAVAALALVGAPLATGNASAASCLSFYQPMHTDGFNSPVLSCKNGQQKKPSAKIFTKTTTKHMTVGQTVEVTVREDSGNKKVNAILARIYYEPSQLKFVRSSTSKPFQVKAGEKDLKGIIVLARGSYQPQTGAHTVATLKFKAVNPGKAAVYVGHDSTLVSATTNRDILFTTSAAGFTISGKASSSSSHKTSPAKRPPSISIAPHFSATNSNLQPSLSAGTVTVTSEDASQPTVLPNKTSVKLTRPATIQTVASHDNHVKKVDYYLNGKKVSQITAAPFQYHLDTKHLLNGTYHFKTKTFMDNGNIQAKNASLVVKNPWSATQAGLQAKHYIWAIIILAIIVVELITSVIVRNRRMVPVLKGNQTADNTTVDRDEPTDDDEMPHITPRDADRSAGGVVRPKQDRHDK
jgi:hypothetical protein